MIISGCLLLTLVSFTYILAPGIDTPSPIGPYLNGIFPDEAPTGSNDSWDVENAFPNLIFTDPLALLEVPGENSYFVVGKRGEIWQIADDPNTTVKDIVLDISAMVDTDGDSGVLNGILHPEFGQAGSPNRGYIYLLYRFHPNGDVSGCSTDAFVRLSRFNRPDGSSDFDPASEFVLVQVFDEHCWHNGGGMFFDPEGYFYFTIGDAGGADDEYNTAQQIDQRLLSGLFRVDLEMDPSRSHPIRRQQIDPPGNTFTTYSSFQQGYYIPNDNPWLDENGGILEEFYALGLRSPHRASLDEVTGDIYVGDVGQGAREEISIAAKGANLQWPFFQGLRYELPPPDPLIGVSTPPIFDYNHSIGTAVIGGFVYRGTNYQGALNGKYLFGDHGVRNIWTLNPANGEVTYLLTVPGSGVGNKNGISSFATNSAGDVFILKLYGTNQDGGIIYKLSQSSSVPEPPATLSLTGAFSDLSTLTPASGLVPYDVNAPLWSDRAVKSRWIALPNDGTHNSADEQITFSETGKWQFPSGTVFVKHFELPVDYNNPGITKRIETRFLVIAEDGGAYGVTYKWRDDESDADLLINSDTKEFTIQNGPSSTQNWVFPSRTDCLTCHNSNAEFVLGVTTWQLNGDYDYPSGTVDNQLNTWDHLNMFANPFDPADIPTFLQTKNINDGSASLETRVRSYLDANCSHCHRPNGVEGAFDARFATPLSNQNIVDVLGISRNTPGGHYIVKPLNTLKSEIWLRDGTTGSDAMPPLAKQLVDDQYIEVLTDWINSLEDKLCENFFASDLNWVGTPVNGWGPVELDKSNNGQTANDGNVITINGQTFQKGLGVHAHSEITYDISGLDFETFNAFIGVDDETCSQGSVIFQVFTDGILAYESPLLTQAHDALEMEVDVSGAGEVKLVVTRGNGSDSCDHADWADAHFKKCCDEGIYVGAVCDDGDPCSVNDAYDENCNCIGTLQGNDSDGDGVCDGEDVCPGSDDTLDADLDGVPDGCDSCAGEDDTLDEDLDGVVDGCDICPGFDDNEDTDSDGFPDGCDICPAGDNNVDTDMDGVPDACDLCPNENDNVDSDFDGIPNACDACPGWNDQDDGDGDGVPDGCDQCPGSDDDLDDDQDGVPDGCDVCPGFDDLADADGDDAPDGCDACPGWDDSVDLDQDGVPEGCDLCPGSDDGMDMDSDGVPDGCDLCPGFDDFLDADGDWVPDGCDVCPGFNDLVDTDADGVPDGCDLCPDSDDSVDSDNDGIPDGCDDCIGLGISVCETGDCTVDGDPITPGTFYAGLRITSTGRVAAGEAVIFKTGNSIELKPGFRVEAGADFQAGIVSCEVLAAETIVRTEEQAVILEPSLSLVSNPVSGETRVLYSMEEDGWIAMDLLDPTKGVIMELLGDTFKEPGRYELLLPDEIPPGVYFVRMWYDGGTVQDKLILTGVGEDKKEVANSLNTGKRLQELSVEIRPNPFREEIHLVIAAPIPEMKRAIIRVIDISGRMIYQRFDAPFNEELTIRTHAGWINGTYILLIHASDYYYTKKIIKQ